MKFINTPVSVDARKGVPRRIRWDRSVYSVRRLLDFWILQSRWWGREEKRVYFRLETDGGVVEVYRMDAPAGTAGPTASSSSSTHADFMEGDTHTRELRQTESPYRPDAAHLAGRRQKKNARAANLEKNEHAGKNARADNHKESSSLRWVLTKVMD